MLNAPQALAVARIGLGLATILNAVEMYALLSDIAAGMVALPLVDWMPRPTSAATTVYLVTAVAVGLALALGWHVASAAALTTVLNVAVFLWDQQTYSSHRLLATLLVAYLIFARSDAVWSVSRRGGLVPWWPRLLMMTQLSVCYFFAAASKVSILFLSGVPLAGWVWIPLPWWMFTLMAFGTVLVELFLTVGLWLRRTRRAAFALGGALHLSIVAMMSDQTWPLIAFGLTCVSLYGLFGSREPMPLLRARGRAGVRELLDKTDGLAPLDVGAVHGPDPDAHPRAQR
jgi:hypothetical protein